MEKSRDIDSKFAVSTDGEIYKKSNNEFIPDDEPLFLLRGRDILALDLLKEYYRISEEWKCNRYHLINLAVTIDKFVRFKIKNPERMKMPSITEGK